MFMFHKKTKPTSIFISSHNVLTDNKLSVESIWQQRHVQSNLAHALSQAVNQTETPLDTALIQYMHVRALSFDSRQPLREFTFDPDDGTSGALWHHGSEYQIAIKGTPEYILNYCDMSENERESVTLQLQTMSGNGSYCVAVASGVLQRPIKHITDLRHKEKLQFVGLVSLQLEVASTARQCISDAASRGMTIYLGTSLHPAATYHLASQLGLASQPQDVFDSQQLDTLTNERLITTISTTKLFARASAKQKTHILSMVKVLDKSTTSIETLEDFKKLLAN